MTATLSHREACYELRRSAMLLKSGKLTRAGWCESVYRILAAWRPDATQGRSELVPTLVEPGPAMRRNTEPESRRRTADSSQGFQVDPVSGSPGW